MYAIDMFQVARYVLTKFHEDSGIGVQAILKFYLRNLRGCNVGITGEKEY
jgi:hypothetical protein